MALDPSIPLAAKAPQVDVASALDLGQQMYANQLKMRQAAQAEEQQNALQKAIASGATPEQLMAISPELGMKYAKEQNALQTAQSEAILKRIEVARTALDGVTTPQQLGAWHDANMRDPILGPWYASRGMTPEKLAPQIAAASRDPRAFANLLNQTRLGAKTVYEQTMQNARANLAANKLNQWTGEVVNTGQVEDYLYGGGYGGGGGYTAPPAATPRPTPAPRPPVAPGQVPASTPQPTSVGAQPVPRTQRDIAVRKLALEEQEATRKAQEAETPLPTKERQRREAAYPKATAALRTATQDIDAQIRDLKALKNSRGLDAISGIVGSRTPDVTPEARSARALYNKIVAKGMFSSLQNLRNASPTGGALGNVSDAEGRVLRESYAALDLGQDARDIRKALSQAIAESEGAKGRLQEAYDMTYEYRSAQPGAAPAGAGGVQVRMPNGKVMSFPSQQQADAFKQAAGIR